MTLKRIIPASLLLLLLAGFTLGCEREAVAPTPIPVDQLPGALQSAFSGGSAEAKDLVSQVVAAIQAQDYSKAHPLLQTLSASPNLTKAQIEVTARGLLTVNELLQTAQAQGDQKAAQTLQNYRANK